VTTSLPTACRSCGATIEWAVTANRKSIPLDPDPHPDGNLVLVWTSPGRQPMALVVNPHEPMLDEPPRYRSHFVTCPNADQHRKAPR
jgi:hypothetical protein